VLLAGEPPQQARCLDYHRCARVEARVSGSRCKAIKAAFLARHGRAPGIIQIAPDAAAGRLYRVGKVKTVRAVSHWRRLKAEQKREASTPRTSAPGSVVQLARLDAKKREAKRRDRKREASA
jgi:hypothetical protein